MFNPLNKNKKSYNKSDICKYVLDDYKMLIFYFKIIISCKIEIGPFNMWWIKKMHAEEYSNFRLCKFLFTLKFFNSTQLTDLLRLEIKLNGE